MDPAQQANLTRFTHFEMLDAIIRLSMMIFDDSELSNLSTRKKLWYMLDPILETIGERRALAVGHHKHLFSDSEDSPDEEPVPVVANAESSQAD
jgi:hypothetical protein